MKCVLFELSYLKNDSRVWSNAKEFLDFLISEEISTAPYSDAPSFITQNQVEDSLATFCFTNDTKINLLFFWENCSYDLSDMNEKSDTFNFFHEFALKWKTENSDVSMRSRKISNFDTLYKRLYSTVWASYNPVVDFNLDSYGIIANSLYQNVGIAEGQPIIDFYDTFLMNNTDDPVEMNTIQNNIIYNDLSELDTSYDEINKIMICGCHSYKDMGEVHHCFNVDDKQNWSLIESYVKSFVEDDNNVSEWYAENNYVLENDTTG